MANMDSLSGIVQAFNALPRPQTTPSGIPSHWVFGIRHVPLQPPGDLVYVVHPQSHVSIPSKTPLQIVSLSTPAEKARTMLLELLNGFIRMGNVAPGMPASEAVPAFAPWTWSCVDDDLGAALQVVLREAGVRAELCKVGVATTAEKDVLGETWSGLVGQMMKMLGQDAASKKKAQKEVKRNVVSASEDPKNLCASCHSPPSQGTSLKTCVRCRAVWYCSRDCQKAGWQEHKRVCGKTEDTIGAIDYFSTIAGTKQAARDLAREINIILPSSKVDFEGTMRPVRRLVVTGKDTPENLRLLFGPAWTAEITDDLKEARVTVLLNPPCGSPAYTMYAPYDVGSPAWAPRPATSEEEARINEIRQIQAKVRERVGVGRSPSNADMMPILMQSDANWDEKLPTYTLAINTMDQGVTPP